MSTLKPLPKDLKQLEQKPRFKQFYKQHTVEQLEEKLIDAGVEYGSDENKAALTWRYMDAKGMDFDNQANDAPVRHDEPVEQPQDEKNANNDVSTEPTPQDDDSKASDTTSDSEQPSESAAQSAQPSVDDESVGNAAKGGDDNAETPPPVSANDNRAPTVNSSEEEQSSAADADQNNQANDKPAAPVKTKAEREFVEVTNNGAYNFYETATGTMLLARKKTKIYPTATIDKAHILRNIDQYNQTRGKTLHVHN